MDFLQVISERLSLLVDNPIAAQAVAGAVEGVVIGLIVGAIVWAIMQAPDTMGRALLLAILIGIGVIIWEFARIGAVVGSGMGNIIGSFNENPEVGRMIMQAGNRTVTGMLIGAFLGVVSQVPQWVIRGGIIGIFIGAIVGAVLGGGLTYFHVNLHQYLFRLLASLGIWAVLATFSEKG